MNNEITVQAGAARVLRDEQGMNTAEYAVGTVSACSFAGILYKILTSAWGQGLLQDLFEKVTDILPF